MRVAISTDGEFVAAHFGRCPLFTIVDIQEGTVRTKDTIPNPGHHPGFIPRFLHERGVTCIVAGGMGARATAFFTEYGMQTIVGVWGKVTEVIEKLRTGTLEGGSSLCEPGSGKGYGIDKTECDHQE